MRIPTSISAATVVVAAATLGLTGATGASAAPPTCADLAGELVGQTCQIRATRSRVHAEHRLPDRLSRRDCGHRLRQADPRRLHQRGQDAWIPLHALRAGHDRHRLRLRDSRRGAPSRWCSRRTRALVAPIRRRSTSRSTGIGARASRSRSTTCFGKALSRFAVILPLVQAEVDKQLGQPIAIPAETGLDPTKYENFAITDDALVFFFSQGDLLPESSGALEVSVPRAPIASHDRLSRQAGANPYT